MDTNDPTTQAIVATTTRHVVALGWFALVAHVLLFVRYVSMREWLGAVAVLPAMLMVAACLRMFHLIRKHQESKKTTELHRG